MLSNVLSQSVNTNHLYHQLFFPIAHSPSHYCTIENTQRAQGSLILLTCFTEYYYTIPTYCVPVLFVPGIKVGSQRTHLWVGCKGFLHSHNFPTRAPVCCLCQQSFQEVNGNTIYLCQSTQQL